MVKNKRKKTFYSGLEYLRPHYSCIKRENMASSLIKKSLLSLLNVPPLPLQRSTATFVGFICDALSVLKTMGVVESC